MTNLIHQKSKGVYFLVLLSPLVNNSTIFAASLKEDGLID